MKFLITLLILKHSPESRQAHAAQRTLQVRTSK